MMRKILVTLALSWLLGPVIFVVAAFLAALLKDWKARRRRNRGR